MSHYNQQYQGAGVYPPPPTSYPPRPAAGAYPPPGHAYPPPPVQGPYVVPPPVSYPMKTEGYPQGPQQPVPYHHQDKGKGGGFWAGCCSAMFCCCLCDLCCLPCSIC
ncbi:PREDICTED: cysteine-rich and transmembrane domain-containing protein A-like [Fragaria vesca subsp. vesca]|uniref:cysteine-rich and transmembrane domain-containing protein A-like n=1 Tax=Fragaria vesca subsp. vesca TaxID=101020 RepID=UPI0002C32469|nr:PREDICTED: cysteine-rich and transmembrane domain-containing protein A-like [Fragaria vesca subsp. vesca]